MGFIEEFKEFATKGNVMDMAVGVMIGAAFGKIVTSLVNDIIMPPIGLATGGINFKDLKLVIQPETLDGAGNTVAAVSIQYGNFIQTSLDFIILALCIFMMVKAVNNARKPKAEEPAAPPVPPQEEVLLAEIRDLLKTKATV